MRNENWLKNLMIDPCCINFPGIISIAKRQRMSKNRTAFYFKHSLFGLGKRGLSLQSLKVNWSCCRRSRQVTCFQRDLE